MALPDDPFLSIAERIMDKVILGNEILNLARFQDWVIAMLVDEVKKLDYVPTVEALETSLKDGFMKAIVFIVGPSSSSNFASKAIENFIQLVPFIFPALLTKLLEAEVAIVVSEEAKRTYRALKLDAARKLTVAGEYSIFVSGFADRLRASSFMSFPSPSAPAAPADGSFHSAEQVEVDAPAVATYGSMATVAEPTQAFRYKKMMTESELATILRAVDKVPLSKPPFTGFGDNRSLSAFKVEITDTVRRRHWSAVHEFHYLSRALEGSLWLLVTVQLFNDLNPQSYVVALEQVWANLDKVCGGQLEQEQLLNTMIDLKQSSDESLSSFLGRVTRFRSQCRASGAMQMRDDSYYMMLSRRGMSSGVVASQAASITCESWIEWVRQVIMIDQRLSSSKPSPSSSPSKILGQTSTTTTPEVQQVAPVRAVDFGVRPDVSQFSNAPSPQTTGQQSHRPNRRGPKKCFTCGKSDHLTKQCPLRRCWNCLSVGHSASECPKSAPANPKSGSGTEAVRVVGSTEGTVHSDERGETVILPSRSVVIRAWGDTHKLDGGILTATYGGKLVLKGLVDTGATDALLSKSVYDQIREHCPEVPSLIPCQATATLANGSTEEVVGTVKLDLIFCDRVVTHDYYVVKELQPGIIWGLRLLGRVGVAIDIGDSAEGLRVTTRVKSPAEGDSEGITQPGIVTSLNADAEEIAVRKVSGLCCALSLEEAAPLLGEKSEDSLSSPVDTAVVHSFVPPSCNEMEFDWRPIPAAPRYDYRVWRADDLSRLAQLWDLPLDDLFDSQRSGGDRRVHCACLVRCAAVLVGSTVTLAKMQCNFAETMALILHCRASKAAGYHDCALGRSRLEERDGCGILTRVVMTIGTPYSKGRCVLVHLWDDREKTDSIIAKCYDEIGHLSTAMTLWHLRRFWWWKGTPFNIMFHRSMYLGSVVPPSSVDAAVDDDDLPTADELKENDEGVLLQRDWVGKVRDDREQPPEDRRQLRPVSAGQKVLVKMADGWRGPWKVLIVHDDKARVTIADKYGVERDEHRANLRVYYGTSEVQAF